MDICKKKKKTPATLSLYTPSPFILSASLSLSVTFCLPVPLCFPSRSPGFLSVQLSQDKCHRQYFCVLSCHHSLCYIRRRWCVSVCVYCLCVRDTVSLISVTAIFCCETNMKYHFILIGFHLCFISNFSLCFFFSIMLLNYSSHHALSWVLQRACNFNFNTEPVFLY